MRILLDECLPKRLKRDLAGHEARTVQEMGWAGKQNGELLGLAAGHFDVFLTVDRNLSFQQNVHNSSLAVIVLIASGNRYSDLHPLAGQINVALTAAAPGQVMRLAAPPKS